MEKVLEEMGFPGGSAGKESACNAGDLGSIPMLGRSPGEGSEYPLQYSCLENSMNCIVQAVTKSRTWLSDFHFTSLAVQEKQVHSLGQEIPWKRKWQPIPAFLRGKSHR